MKVFIIFFMFGISSYIFHKVFIDNISSLSKQESDGYKQIKTKNFFFEKVSLNRIFDDEHSWTATLSADRKRTLLVTGDVIPARVVNIQATKFNNFLWSFEKVAHVLKDSDITYINLETPLIKNCPLINEGFVFCGNSRHVEGLMYAGVDVANLANNHIGNYGEEAIIETVTVLEENGIEVSGQNKPLYKNIKGMTFAFLGYNDIGFTPDSIGHAKMEVIEQDIRVAKSQADIVVVQYHWGEEYRSQPDDRQITLGKFAIDKGADLVIGNHPHWIQPIEFYKDKLITYAHGNFIFDQEWSMETKQGVVGKYIYYDDQLIDVEYLPIQIENYGQPYPLEGERRQEVLNNMKKESIKRSKQI